MSKSYLKCKLCKKFGACAALALETGSVFCHYGTGLSCLKWAIRIIPIVVLVLLNVWAIPTLGTKEVPFYGCDIGWVTVAKIITTLEVATVIVLTIVWVLAGLEDARQKGMRVFAKEYGCKRPDLCTKHQRSSQKTQAGQAPLCETCEYRIKL